MTYYCQYKDCPNIQRAFCSKTFFNLPSDKRRDKWIQNSGNYALANVTTGRCLFCEDHFHPSFLRRQFNRTILRRDAIPYEFSKHPKIPEPDTIEVEVEEKSSEESSNNAIATTRVFRLVNTSPSTNPPRRLNPSLSNLSNQNDKDDIEIIYIPLDESSCDTQTIIETSSKLPNQSDESDNDEYLLPKRQRGNTGQSLKFSSHNDKTTTPKVVIKANQSIGGDMLVQLQEVIETTESPRVTLSTAPKTPSAILPEKSSAKTSKRSQATSSTMTVAEPTTKVQTFLPEIVPRTSANIETTSPTKSKQSTVEKTTIAEQATESTSNGIASGLKESLLARANLNDNEETFFALSLVEILKRLPHKKRAKAKCHIINYLTELEYDS